MAVRRSAALLLSLVALGLWIGCAATPPRMRPVLPERPVARAPGKILFVLSPATQQPLRDGSKRKTGTFLGEFYQPYAALKNHGYEIVMATATGAGAAIDPESLDDKYWDDPGELERALKFVERSAEVRAPIDLTQALAAADSFQGIVVPGGQGMMVDLLDDAELHALLAHFGARDQPVGLVCHAPALLTRLRNKGRLAERTVTSVSWFEEFYIETFVMGAEAETRGIGGELEAHGYAHEAGLPGSEHALRDCNLVTSQNPFSTRRFNELYLEALSDYRRGARCEPQPR